jgi:hypothetical protein
VKFRKITVTVAAAALTLPAALATASTAASAGGVIPPLVIDTSGIPPLCASTDPVIQTVCQTANDTHSATFSGTYHAVNNSFNDTNETYKGVPGACADGSGAASVPLCRFTFLGGNPATACTPNTTTSWSKPAPGSNAWTYYPDKNDLSKSIGSPQLFAEGGGVIDNTVTTTDSYGNVLVYRVHIQIHALCGNEDTAQGLADDITARAGLGSGAIDLKTAYKFSGYIDIL